MSAATHQGPGPTIKPVVEILTIGREILDGRVIDTNAVFIAETLKARGLVPRFGQRVDDDLSRVVEAFQIAGNRADIVLVTGGLGPTSDDLTIEAFAKYLGTELALNETALSDIKAYLKKIERPYAESQRKQALFPPNAFILHNPEGTAPGVGFERPNPTRPGQTQQWFFMPGVPKEMKRMLTEQVSPRLPRLPNYRSYTWVTQFTSEGELQSRLGSLIGQLPSNIELSFRTRFPENHIGLHADCASAEDKKLFDDFRDRITSLLGDDVFTAGEVRSLEEVVIQKLATREGMMATVESCTGGLVAHRLTEISGASQIFWGSWVVYDNAAKELLGVPSEILRAHGAVSRENAKALAEAGLAHLRQRAPQRAQELYCVATTGIAGPGGGSAAKPVGLCFIAVASSSGPTQVEELRARQGLDRTRYKSYFAQKALDLLRRTLLAREAPHQQP